MDVATREPVKAWFRNTLQKTRRDVVDEYDADAPLRVLESLSTSAEKSVTPHLTGIALSAWMPPEDASSVYERRFVGMWLNLSSQETGSRKENYDFSHHAQQTEIQPYKTTWVIEGERFEMTVGEEDCYKFVIWHKQWSLCGFGDTMQDAVDNFFENAALDADYFLSKNSAKLTTQAEEFDNFLRVLKANGRI